MKVLNSHDYFSENSHLGVILSEESIALIRFSKIWPLGGENADFILLKLNNLLFKSIKSPFESPDGPNNSNRLIVFDKTIRFLESA